jgi:uncharacterized membrane protein
MLEMMFTPGKESLCLQTLRNYIYGATVFTSLTSASALILLTHGFDSKPFFFEFKIQMYCLSAILFISYTFFALSVRLVFHLQFLILTKNMKPVRNAIDEYFDPSNKEKDLETLGLIEKEDEIYIFFNFPHDKYLDIYQLYNVEKSKRYIVLSKLFFTIGVRGLLISIPCVFWVILGMWTMLGTTILLLIFLIFYDIL